MYGGYMASYSVAIIGATGLVVSTLLSLFEYRSIPIKKLFLVASQQSVGKELTFRGEPHPIYDLSEFDFNQSNFAFFCVGNQLTSLYAPKAVAAGNVVIDKSFFFRNHDDV